MISRSEARARKAELDAASAFTAHERAELVEVRKMRDEARSAMDAAHSHWWAARRSRKATAGLEDAFSHAEDRYALASREANAVEARIGQQRQARVREVKRAHQQIDDQRTARRIATTRPVRIVVFDGEPAA
jgi:hypothetical protein